MKRLSAALAVVALLLSGMSPAVFAQTYPTGGANYTPAAVLAPTTLSAPGNVVFQSNSIGTLNIRLSGAFTGLAATIQVSEARTGTINWTPISAVAVNANGGNIGTRSTLSVAGLYRVDVSGYAQVRVNVSAISTGSVIVSASGGNPDGVDYVTPIQRSTYSATAVGLVPAASATDFLTLTGSATTTVRVIGVYCSGVSTAAATQSIVALTRSTADTGGTSTNPTKVPNDPNSPAATAVVAAYTANPASTGTLVGNVRAGYISTVTAASTAVPAEPLNWFFGNQQSDQEIVLRGTTSVFALNAAGASFSAGTLLNCHISWTEE